MARAKKQQTVIINNWYYDAEAEESVRKMLSGMKEAGFKAYEVLKEKTQKHEESIKDYVAGMLKTQTDYLDTNDSMARDFIQRFLFQMRIYAERMGFSEGSQVHKSLVKLQEAVDADYEENGYCDFNFDEVFKSDYLEDAGSFVAENTVLYDSDSLMEDIRAWEKSAEDSEELRKTLDRL